MHWQHNSAPQLTWLNISCREEQVLILSGGLTIHNLRDFPSFSPASARPQYKEFDQAVLDAVTVSDVRYDYTS